MEVVVSGCVFSSLVYELTNSKGDVEGLLIGQITSRTVNTVTDSQTQNLKHERVATIQGFIPFNRTYSFYDHAGHINDQAVVEEPNENGKTQKVIGWYKFRRNSQGLVSMREKVVHHNLVEKLNFTPAKEFILAIFTASMNKEMSNHKLDYCFCHSAHRRGLFQPIPVQILNLGDTSHSEYRLKSHASPSTSNIFYEVIDSYRNDFVDNNGYIQMTSTMHSMYITMMKKLQDLVEVVKGSEKGILSLSEEVDSRRRELKDVQLQLASRNEPCNVDEKRPLQPCAIHSHSSQENEDVHRSVISHGSETSAVVNDMPASGCDSMEIEDESSILKEKPKIMSNKQYNTETGNSSKQRKQSHPNKIRTCVSGDDDDDDDVTDDETQSSSFNGHSKGIGQEGMNTENQSIESSPVF